MVNFSLRNFLTFFLALCAYLAALLAMYRIVFDETFPFSLEAALIAPLAISWVLLFVVYLIWRLRGVLIIHIFAPVAAIALMLKFAYVDELPLSTPVGALFRGVALGCFLGVFVSFPIATLILLNARYEGEAGGSA